jgi:hypothetical protein
MLLLRERFMIRCCRYGCRPFLLHLSALPSRHGLCASTSQTAVGAHNAVHALLGHRLTAAGLLTTDK